MTARLLRLRRRERRSGWSSACRLLATRRFRLGPAPKGGSWHAPKMLPPSPGKGSYQGCSSTSEPIRRRRTALQLPTGQACATFCFFWEKGGGGGGGWGQQRAGRPPPAALWRFPSGTFVSRPEPSAPRGWRPPLLHDCSNSGERRRDLICRIYEIGRSVRSPQRRVNIQQYNSPGAVFVVVAASSCSLANSAASASLRACTLMYPKF
jgi:hypothetical protein